MKLGADGCRETWGTGRAGIGRARVRRGLPGCERPGAAVAQAPTRAQQGILADRPYYLAAMALGRASSGPVLSREHWPSCQVHSDQSQEKCTPTVQANTDSWKSIPHPRPGKKKVVNTGLWEMPQSLEDDENAFQTSIWRTFSTAEKWKRQRWICLNK